MLMKELQYLPKPRDKGHVIRNRWIRLEECDQARAFMAEVYQ